MKRLIALAVFPLIGVVSCSQGASQTAAAKYDGRTLFRGLVFFEGNVSNNIKLLNDVRRANRIDSLNQYQATAFNNYKEYTTKFIDKYYPGFFDEFAAMIQSGNPVIVDAALRRAGQLVLESWALRPLLVLTRSDQVKLALSPKTKAALDRLSAAKTIEEVRNTVRTAGFGRDLILFDARALNLNVRLDNQLALNRYVDLDYFVFHNLDFSITTDAFRQQARDWNRNIQLPRQIDIQLPRSIDRNLYRLADYNRFFNLQFARDIDLGAGSWFNENEWLNENRYVNNNENFNVDRNVNVKEDVSVVVEAVIFAVVGFEGYAGVDSKAQFLREELVRSITENFATRS